MCPVADRGLGHAVLGGEGNIIYLFVFSGLFRLTLLFCGWKFGSNIFLNKRIILLRNAWLRRRYFVLFCIHISSIRPANQTKIIYLFVFRICKFVERQFDNLKKTRVSLERVSFFWQQWQKIIIISFLFCYNVKCSEWNVKACLSINLSQ